MSYRHTQESPMFWILLAPCAVLMVVLPFVRERPGVFFVLAAWAALLLLATASFRNLTVADGGDRLLVRFGPLPLLRASFRYDRITAVERSRSSWIDGWGIHWVPGRGMTYNVWGFDCVKLCVASRVVRIGSDDADALADFLSRRVEAS